MHVHLWTSSKEREEEPLPINTIVVALLGIIGKCQIYNPIPPNPRLNIEPGVNTPSNEPIFSYVYPPYQYHHVIS